MALGLRNKTGHDAPSSAGMPVHGIEAGAADWGPVPHDGRIDLHLRFILCLACQLIGRRMLSDDAAPHTHMQYEALRDLLAPTAASVAATSRPTAAAVAAAASISSTMSTCTLAAAESLSTATHASITAAVATLLLHAQYGRPALT